MRPLTTKPFADSFLILGRMDIRPYKSSSGTQKKRRRTLGAYGSEKHRSAKTTLYAPTSLTLRIAAGVALAAAFFVNHGGDAALGAEVADLHG